MTKKDSALQRTHYSTICSFRSLVCNFGVYYNFIWFLFLVSEILDVSVFALQGTHSFQVDWVVSTMWWWWWLWRWWRGVLMTMGWVGLTKNLHSLFLLSWWFGTVYTFLVLRQPVSVNFVHGSFFSFRTQTHSQKLKREVEPTFWNWSCNNRVISFKTTHRASVKAPSPTPPLFETYSPLFYYLVYQCFR